MIIFKFTHINIILTYFIITFTIFYFIFFYNIAMTLQERKDKADIIAKEVDIVYKKLFVLMAVSGAIGGFF